MKRLRSEFLVVVCVASAAAIASSAIASADDVTEIDLWPDGVSEFAVPAEPQESLETGADGLTRRFNVSRPRLFLHLPSAATHTGAAIVIVPGGGFARLADEHEGSDVAAWLNGLGITAFPLAYRTPTIKHANPVAGPAQDIRRAVAEIRRRAVEWNVDPERIGVMGFSAGGQAALVAASAAGRAQEVVDPLVRPNALLLVYPYQVMDSATRELRSDVTLDAEFPPTFLAQAADDKASDPEGSVLLFRELHRRSIVCELHVYENGGHGFGMRPRPGFPGSRDWSSRAADWLQLRGFTAMESPAHVDE